MSNRTIVIIAATVLGCALLGPYIGLHLFTARPEEESTPQSPRDNSRRIVAPSRQPLARPERSASDSNERDRRDLTDIEDLLGRNELSGGALPTVRGE